MGEDLDTAIGQVRRHLVQSLRVIGDLDRFLPENTEQLETQRGIGDRHDH